MSTDFVEVRNLQKRYAPGTKPAVAGISFGVKKGELLVLLGPSGCGKTTTLRCIAGLEETSDGEILIDGVTVNRGNRAVVPPDKRQIGMVFQSYAVWPHMTVFENVAFPLRLRKTPPAEIRKRVQDALALVGLDGLHDRGVTQLSGGQQQRVSLARALVFEPRLLLFDEPLSNLDMKLREHMRVELRRLVKQLGLTAIHVTHDQEEAMTIGDRLIVMNDGRISQEGDAESLYTKPQSPFVANFIGVTNLVKGALEVGEQGAWVRNESGLRLPGLMEEELPAGTPVCLSIRPELISATRTQGEDSPTELRGEVVAVFFLGDRLECRVKVGGLELRVKLPAAQRLQVGDLVNLQIRREDCMIFVATGSQPNPGEEVPA